jgi:hypothetical protein
LVQLDAANQCGLLLKAVCNIVAADKLHGYLLEIWNDARLQMSCLGKENWPVDESDDLSRLSAGAATDSGAGVDW